MPRWLKSGRTVALSVAVAVAVLLTVEFITPPAHEVHTPGAIAVNTQLVDSNPFVVAYPPIQPSQSLDTVRCEIWRTHRQHGPACDSTILATTYFPNVTQSPMTLYIPWSACSSFNVEYRPWSRSVVIHCYTAEPWISLAFLTEQRAMGVEAQPQLALLLIPTQSIPAGNVNVVEDNRVERLLLDSSDEFQLGTATIS